MASDNLLLQSLSDHALVADAIELLTVLWANQRALNSSSNFPIMAQAMSNHHEPPQ
jgi:hypothetical protein